MVEQVVGPTSHYYYSQRLKLHYVDWGNSTAPPLLLIHGGRDHARTWDWVAQALRTSYHIIAPDLRGHGDSEWARGSQYAMIDYVLDMAQLLEQLQWFPITIIGHSLGGGIACQYTGIYPERVKQLVAIEGLGPQRGRSRQGPAHERMHDWINQMRTYAGRRARHYASLEEAVQRMQEANKRLTAEQAHHLTVHGSYRNEDGTYTWKFDNYVRSQSPYEFNVEEARSIWQRITCPTLLLRGSESWATDPSQDGRAQAFRNARCVDVARAGHWVHHDQLEEFLRVVRAFFTETA
ncbi:MAG: alpha/beta fold hydrolase [Candidatus Tectimicrobiota bacterium]